VANLLRKFGRWLLGSPLGQRVYDLLANLIQRHLHVVLTGPGRGLKLWGGGTPGYVLGLSERAVQQALAAHLGPGNVFWDVGAHAGFLALIAGRLVGQTGEVHCFEPVPKIVDLLQRNFDANGYQGHIHQLALAERDGTGHMKIGRRIGAKLSDDGVAVRLCRADSLDLPAPTVVKIDVEGAESRVLAGMTRILTEHKPVIIVETHGTAGEVRAQLDAHGYTVEALADRGGMPHLIGMARPQASPARPA
jgi:FkbM family methyltransferase